MPIVSRSVTLNARFVDVWALIGGFQNLADWHPAVQSVVREDINGREHRRIFLEGGGEILEKLHDHETGSYSYSIVESPLPVENYLSNLSSAEVEGQTVITWSSRFVATADHAEEVIAGIYDAGFEFLQRRFG